MKNFGERDFTTYPRRFLAYRWYKPLLTGLLFILFYFGSMRSGTTILNLLMQSTPEREKLSESDLTNMNGDTIR